MIHLQTLITYYYNNIIRRLIYCIRQTEIIYIYIYIYISDTTLNVYYTNLYNEKMHRVKKKNHTFLITFILICLHIIYLQVTSTIRILQSILVFKKYMPGTSYPVRLTSRKHSANDL